MVKETSSYLSLRLHLDDDDDDDDAMMGTTHDGIVTPEQQKQQQPLLWRWSTLLLVLLGVTGALLVLGRSFFSSTVVNSPGKNHQQHDGDSMEINNNEYYKPLEGWIALQLPSDLTLLSVSEGGAVLSMNTDGSILAVLGVAVKMHDGDDTATKAAGQGVVLQAQQGDLRYRTIQTLQASDDYSAFASALAMSSLTSNTFTAGIPRNDTDYPYNKSSVNVYRQNDGDQNDWELVEAFTSQSPNEMAAGSWVAVSDNGCDIVYSAPNVQADLLGNKSYMAVVAYEQGKIYGEQDGIVDGECSSLQSIDQPISMSTFAIGRPVLVLTHGEEFESTQRTIDVWEGNSVFGTAVTHPCDECMLLPTGTAATMVSDGRRFVVLAACRDLETYQTKHGIYTFEKMKEYDDSWNQFTSCEVVIIDSDLSQYRMSAYAFDDAAMTLVVTAARGDGDVQGKNIVCYKWDETSGLWQESWSTGPAADSDFGIVAQVALSGNGKRLAILASTAEGLFPHLAVYDLP